MVGSQLRSHKSAELIEVVHTLVPGRSLQDTEDQFVHACDQTPADTRGLAIVYISCRLCCTVHGCSCGEKSKKGFLSSRKIRCHVLRITARVKQRQLSWASHWGHMHEDNSAAI